MRLDARRLARLVTVALGFVLVVVFAMRPVFAGPDAGAPTGTATAKNAAPKATAAPASSAAPLAKPKPKKNQDAGADASAESADASVTGDAAAETQADASSESGDAAPAASSSASAGETPQVGPPAPPLPESAAAPPPPKPTVEPAFVLVHNRPVFEVRVARGGSGPKERAGGAADIIERILSEPDPVPRATIVPLSAPGEFALRLGDRDVFGFGPEDVNASGLAPEAYAESLRLKVDSFLSAERQRARLQAWVLSVILAVFLGILAVFLLRWVRILSDRAQHWAESKAASLPALQFKDIEVLSAQALRSSLYVLVGVGRVLLQIGLVYGYLAVSLGQFETTRPWVRQITGFLVTPFGELAERIGLALPAAILLVASAYVIRTGLRVTGFFFDHLARGEVKSAWIPPELATPARPLARVALVLLALLALGPIVSGASDGLLVRIGVVALGTLALASVPVVGAISVGTIAIFTGRYRLGEWVTIGKHTGEVTQVGFLDVCLVPRGAGRVRIPHLMSLLVPVAHLAGPPRIEYDVPVDPHALPENVIKVLEAAAAPLGESAEVYLVDISSRAARYRVSLREPKSDARAQLVSAVMVGLRQAKIGLGAPGSLAET